jgi:putative nucleotide binding protein
MEDYVYILDYVTTGIPARDQTPMSFGIGETEFTLLGLIPKSGITLTNGERIYVGKEKEKRKKIDKVKGRVDYEDLSAAAHGELPYVILDIVSKNEPKYIHFFNTCPAITARYHALELLPGLGKKTLKKLIFERRVKPFESFKEMETRVKNLHHPDKLIAKRIEDELRDPNQKYRLFTRSPVKK